MSQNYFPQRPSITPTVYAYRLIGVDTHEGYLKVGYTDRTAEERIDEQLHTSKLKYEIVLQESAMSNDGSCFTDKDVHRILESKDSAGSIPSTRPTSGSAARKKTYWLPYFLCAQAPPTLRTEAGISSCARSNTEP